MKRAVKTALLESIEIWQQRARGEVRIETCPLCRQFLNEDKIVDCTIRAGCPVWRRTGKKGCTNTPFFPYHDAKRQDRSHNTPRVRRLAHKMVGVLIRCLP